MQSLFKKNKEVELPSKLTTLLNSAKEGDAVAQSKLGMIYYWDYADYNIIRDEKKAVTFWKMSADQGEIYGCFFYALSLTLGIGGVKQDSELIQKYADQAKTGGLLTKFQKRAGNDCMTHQYFLALCYAHGIMVNKSYMDAEKLLIKATKKNFEWAYVELGIIYESFMEREVIYGTRCEWRNQSKRQYKKAIKKNNAVAKFRLGKIYEESKLKFAYYPSLFELKDVIKLYTESAKQGYVDAQYELGCLYGGWNYSWTSVAVDLEKSFFWFTCAMQQGSAKGACAVGMMHEKGLYVAKSFNLAKKCYLQAVEKGYEEAYSLLGHLFKRVNSAQAMKYFNQASDATSHKQSNDSEDTPKLIYQALQTRIKKADHVICQMQREVNRNELLPSQIPSLEIVELIMQYGNLFSFHYYLVILNSYSNKRHLKRAMNVRDNIHRLRIGCNTTPIHERATAKQCLARRDYLWHHQIKKGKLKDEPCERHPILDWLNGTQGTDEWRVEQDHNGKIVDQFFFLLKNLYATAPLAVEPYCFTRALSPPPAPS